MQPAYQRAQVMLKVLGFNDDDAKLIKESLPALTASVGPLMAAVGGRLVQGPAEEHFFDDDPDAAQAFGSRLTEFVMRSTSGGFTEEYCAYVAGLPSGLKPRPPLSVWVAVMGVISGWLAHTLSAALRENADKLGKTLAAWQKLLSVNLELLATPYAL